MWLPSLADAVTQAWFAAAGEPLRLSLLPISTLECIRNLRIIRLMKAVFVELPAFARYRADYLDDADFRGLQEAMMKNPEAGELSRVRVVCASFGMVTHAGAKASAAACG